MKKAVIVTGPKFEDAEVIYPFYRLLEEGMSVDIVTSNNTDVTGKYGYPIKPTTKITNLKVKNYDAVIIPGGHEAPDRVRQVPEIVYFVKKMFEEGKVVSSTCHGPWVLIEADIVRGKNVTCYPGMKTDLKNAGGNYLIKPVVVDDNMITSDHPRNLGLWMLATIKVINSNNTK